MILKSWFSVACHIRKKWCMFYFHVHQWRHILFYATLNHDFCITVWTRLKIETTHQNVHGVLPIRGQYQRSSESIPAQHRTNACFSVFSPMLPNPNWSVAIMRSWLGSDDPVRSITVLVQYRRAENLYQPCIRSLRVTARCTLCYQYLTGPLLESVTAWYR